MAEDFEAQELTEKKFDVFVKSGLSLIDFYAEWCMPCLMMEPVVSEVGERLQGKIKVGKINIDSEKSVAQKFNVRSIPNFILFKNGQVIGQFIGAMGADEFEKKLKSYL